MLFFNKFSILLTYLMFFFVDSAYLSSAACEVLQPTAWIPLIDANKINGCMQVIALSISRLITPSTHQRNLVHNIWEVTFMSRSCGGFLSSCDDYSLVKFSVWLRPWPFMYTTYMYLVNGFSVWNIILLCYFVQCIQCIVFLTFGPKLEYET